MLVGGVGGAGGIGYWYWGGGSDFVSLPKTIRPSDVVVMFKNTFCSSSITRLSSENNFISCASSSAVFFS